MREILIAKTTQIVHNGDVPDKLFSEQTSVSEASLDMDFSKYAALLVPIFLFAAALGALFWRMLAMEKRQDTHETKVENQMLRLQLEHKENLEKLRAETKAELEKIERGMDEQRKAASENFSKIDGKMDMVKDGINGLKVQLAQLGSVPYSQR